LYAWASIGTRVVVHEWPGGPNALLGATPSHVV